MLTGCDCPADCLTGARLQVGGDIVLLDIYNGGYTRYANEVSLEKGGKLAVEGCGRHQAITLPPPSDHTVQMTDVTSNGENTWFHWTSSPPAGKMLVYLSGEEFFRKCLGAGGEAGTTPTDRPWRSQLPPHHVRLEGFYFLRSVQLRLADVHLWQAASTERIPVKLAHLVEQGRLLWQLDSFDGHHPAPSLQLTIDGSQPVEYHPVKMSIDPAGDYETSIVVFTANDSLTFRAGPTHDTCAFSHTGVEYVAEFPHVTLSDGLDFQPMTPEVFQLDFGPVEAQPVEGGQDPVEISGTIRLELDILARPVQSE